MPIEIRELVVESHPQEAAPEQPAPSQPTQPTALETSRLLTTLHHARAVRAERLRAD